MSNKDSDWDMEDDMEFSQELEQNSGQDDPYQSTMGGQEAGDPPYDPSTEYTSTPTEESVQSTPDTTADQYQEFGAGEYSADDSDFDDYDFMDETPAYDAGTSGEYTDEVAAYSDGDDDFTADEFSEYADEDGGMSQHEQRKFMDQGLGESGKKPIGTIALIAVAGILVLGGSYFAFTSLFGGSDAPQPRPNQIAAQNDNFPEDDVGGLQENEATDTQDMFDDGIRPPAIEQNDVAGTDAANNDPGPLTPLPGEEENIGFFTAGHEADNGGGIQFNVPDNQNQAQNEGEMFASIEDPQSVPQGEPEDVTEEVDITEAATDFFESLDEPVEEPAPVPQETVNVPPAPVPSQASSTGSVQVNNEVLEQLRELNATIDQLSQRVGTLEDSMETVEANLNSRISALEKRPVSETRSSTPTSITEKKPVKQTAAAMPAPKKETAPAASAPRASSWEIRAIQVGKAVVAQRGTQGSREISVGDSLPGLGTIQAIDYRNGQWVISGTQGTIRE
jgi:TolA-binding protein